ncbi:MAG: MmgE/PrpD family protein, partial [Acidobacteria bacterium]|nr:MmgE/PrpD family protein [Acidobacteriota bacterium]
SMPFCAAAALVDGRVGIDTFDDARLRDQKTAAVQSRVTMRVDPTLDAAAPALTQARVTVTLKDGRVLTSSANGARGCPERPASDEELAAKFLACATRVLAESAARKMLAMLLAIETVADIRAVAL